LIQQTGHQKAQRTLVTSILLISSLTNCTRYGVARDIQKFRTFWHETLDSFGKSTLSIAGDSRHL
jgi:hypothetical protein